jgi:hypothetical protein
MLPGGGPSGGRAKMLDKFLTGIIWFCVGAVAVYIAASFVGEAVAAHTHGEAWWVYPVFIIFWAVASSIFPEDLPDMFGPILLLLPAIGVYLWRQHLREKARDKRMSA